MDLDALHRAMQIPVYAVTSPVATPAEQVLGHLKTVITEFMATIDPDREVAIYLASFGHSRVIYVESVKALGAQLILFSGIENGHRVQLVQHVSQLNFLLSAEPAVSPIPRRIIGFQAE